MKEVFQRYEIYALNDKQRYQRPGHYLTTLALLSPFQALLKVIMTDKRNY